MVRRAKNKSCHTPIGEMGCCSVESVVTIDKRGQMVLPKEIRDKVGLKAGDKLAVVTWGMMGKAGCICLIKVRDFEEMVKGFLGPMFKGMFSRGGKSERQ